MFKQALKGLISKFFVFGVYLGSIEVVFADPAPGLVSYVQGFLDQAKEKLRPSVEVNSVSDLWSPEIRAQLDKSKKEGFFPPRVIPSEKFKRDVQTQTELHCLQNFDRVMRFVRSNDFNFSKKPIGDMFSEALKKEKEQCHEGRYVFWHARDYKFDYYSFIYKQLHNINNPENPAPNDFEFLRFDYKRSPWIGDCRGPDALFMNGALFGYSPENFESTESTVEFLFGDTTSKLVKNILNNLSESHVLSRFKMQHLHEKYNTELQHLEDLHRKANPCLMGNLLMISVDDHHMNHVSSVRLYASRQHPIELGNGEKTAQAKKIIDALKAGTLPQSNEIEYALALTEGYALNPAAGLKIYSFNAVDQEKYAAFKAYGDQLFARIKNDIASIVSVKTHIEQSGFL